MYEMSLSSLLTAIKMSFLLINFHNSKSASSAGQHCVSPAKETAMTDCHFLSCFT